MGNAQKSAKYLYLSLLGALAVVDLPAILLSVLGAVVLNLVLAFNHKAGRYTAIS